jgi:hypothetical protein
MRLATASRRVPGADNYVRWWLVSTITGGPSGQLRGHTWTGGKRHSCIE